MLSLYSYISRIIDMHTNRGKACRSPFIMLRGNLIQHLPQVLPTKFRFIWLSSYREKDYYKSTNQKLELPVVAMFVNGSELNQNSGQRTVQGCFLLSVYSFGQALSAEMITQKSTSQKQELPLAVMFVNGSEKNEELYRGPSKDASYQILIHLAKLFQRRRFFRNQPIRNKN